MTQNEVMTKLIKQLEQTIINQKGMMSPDEYDGFKIGMEMAIAIVEQDGYIEDEKVEVTYVEGDLNNINL
jgi:hypothetical protein